MTDERLRELYQRAIDSRTSRARTDCPDPERLLALARREGSEEERLRTLDHATQCNDCMRELALLRSIEQAGMRAGAGAAVHRASSASWRRAVPLALAASLVLAVTLVVRSRDSASLADDRMRGGDATVALHTPRDLTLERGDSLRIVWAPVAGASSYVVEVLDDGRVALSETTSDTLLVVRDLSRLTPRRDYGWWVRARFPGGTQRSSALGRLRLATP